MTNYTSLEILKGSLSHLPEDELNSIVAAVQKEQNARKNKKRKELDVQTMKKEKCPAYDYECPYCDEWGYCELENPETECDNFMENIPYEDV